MFATAEAGCVTYQIWRDSQLKGFPTLKVSISVSGHNSSQGGHRDMKLSPTDVEKHGDSESGVRYGI